MASSPTQGGGYVVPNTGIPQTLGILNIVFALLILACNAVSFIAIAFMPTLNRSMQQVQTKMQAEADRRKEAELKIVAEREEKASTPAEKDQIARQRAAIQARPKVTIGATMDFSQYGMNDPKFRLYWYGDAATSFLLNAIMLATGIGLLSRKPWARRAWLWTAGVKIVRLALLQGYFALVVVPIIAPKIAQMVVAMMQQQQAAMGRTGGPPVGLGVDQFTRLYAITYTVTAALTFLVGSIYPIVSLWLLNKRSVRAAFLAPEPRPEPDPT